MDTLSARMNDPRRPVKIRILFLTAYVVQTEYDDPSLFHLPQLTTPRSLIGNTDSDRMYKCLAEASTGLDEGRTVRLDRSRKPD